MSYWGERWGEGGFECESDTKIYQNITILYFIVGHQDISEYYHFIFDHYVTKIKHQSYYYTMVRERYIRISRFLGPEMLYVNVFRKPQNILTFCAKNCIKYIYKHRAASV